MRFLFFGLIFLMFDITVTELRLDILFDFVGWALMFLGFKSLGNSAKVFSRLKPICAFMFLISVVFVSLKTFEFSNQNGAFFTADLIYSVLKTASLTAVLMRVFKQSELVKNRALIYRAKNIWLIYLLLWAVYLLYAALILSHIPASIGVAVTQILVIAMLFTQVLFLITIYSLKKNF